MNMLIVTVIADAAPAADNACLAQLNDSGEKQNKT
jgi:hypothetical protein